MVGPTILVVLIILGLPVLYNIYLSITDASALTGLTDLDFVGLSNYENVLQDPRFQRAFQLTIVWTIANLALQLALGMALALLLHAARGRLGAAVRVLWVLPWLLPAASAFYVWRLMYQPQVGPLGQLFTELGLARPILGDPSLAMVGVIIAAAWKGFPFYMLMFYSGLASVPQDLYDAARVDGAGRWRVFRDIELPEIRPIVGLAAILGFVWIFNWMTPLLIMTEGGPGGATTTLGLWVYFEALRGFRLSNAAVGSTVLVVIVLLIFLTLYLRRRHLARTALEREWVD
jgi:multiple sugar transport system permease protein